MEGTTTGVTAPLLFPPLPSGVVFAPRQFSPFQYPTRTGLRCPDCNKRFARPVDLERHEKIHTGKGLFTCSKCPGLRFPLKAQLKTHARIHMKQTKLVEPVFGCPLCHKTFENRWGLTRHQVIHSTEKPHLCLFCDRGYSHRYQLYVKRPGGAWFRSDSLAGRGT